MIITVTAIQDISMYATIGVAATALLIAFLATKELARGSDSASRLAKFLSVGIIPLSIVFAVIVVFKVVEIIA